MPDLPLSLVERLSTVGRVFRQRVVQALGRLRSAHRAADQNFVGADPVSVQLLVIALILLHDGSFKRQPGKQTCDREFSGKLNGRGALTAPTAVSPASTAQQKQH